MKKHLLLALAIVLPNFSIAQFDGPPPPPPLDSPSFNSPTLDEIKDNVRNNFTNLKNTDIPTLSFHWEDADLWAILDAKEDQVSRTFIASYLGVLGKADSLKGLLIIKTLKFKLGFQEFKPNLEDLLKVPYPNSKITYLSESNKEGINRLIFKIEKGEKLTNTTLLCEGIVFDKTVNIILFEIKKEEIEPELQSIWVNRLNSIYPR